MKIKETINKYLEDNTYKITIFDKYINVNNYIEIKDFSSTEILIKHKNGITSIKGIDLRVNKMIDNEVLITGKITNITLS